MPDPTIPEVDPIPLPAPVWLFKLLHDLTLTLHFSAVHLLLGGLLIGVIVHWLGRRTRRADLIETSGAVAGWLPILMIYVINLGVPPLLFAQVLYGRALYTSSILIGIFWIAVIPLLIVCYQLLYLMQARAQAGRSWGVIGLAALLLTWVIAMIYSTNMTLMLDPANWREIYRDHPTGTSLVPFAVLVWLPRWLYMMAAGITASAVLIGWLSTSSGFSEATRQFMRSFTGRFGLGGGLVCLGAGLGVWFSQPGSVHKGFSANPVWLGFAGLWFLAVAGVVGLGAFLVFKKPPLTKLLLAGLSAVAFLQIAGAVVCRDGIRDALLAQAGFDVWQRQCAVNWSVLILFFVLFVIGLGIVGWLAYAYLFR